MHDASAISILASTTILGAIELWYYQAMQPLTPEDKLAAWRSFLEAHAKIIRVLEREMQAEQELPLSWYDILAHLDSAANGRLRMQELADSVLLSRSGLTRMVDRMAKSNLVSRAPCPNDRRGTYAVITSEGRTTLKQAMPGHLRGVEHHFLNRLNDADIQALDRTLAKVLEAETLA
jgi:DNA-binding MarR family transcriptional regulator